MTDNIIDMIGKLSAGELEMLMVYTNQVLNDAARGTATISKTEENKVLPRVVDLNAWKAKHT